jgi:hypothetical protein
MSNYYIKDEDIDYISNQVLIYLKKQKRNSYTDMVNDIIFGYTRSGEMSAKQRSIVARLYFVYIYNWNSDILNRNQIIEVWDKTNTKVDSDLSLEFKPIG